MTKAELVRATIGGPTFGKHLQPSKAETMLDRVKTNVKVGDIKQALEERAIPHLTLQLDQTQEQIRQIETETPRLISLYEEYLRQKLEVERYFDRIKIHVQAGRLPKQSLENAKQVLDAVVAYGLEPEMVRARQIFEAQKVEKEKEEEEELPLLKINL